MIITKQSLPRRTILRGLGAAVALPLLDGMVPALTALRNTAANPTRRFGAVYVPNGMTLEQWTPAAEGEAFELTPILQPLAAYRNKLLVLSGFSNQTGDGLPSEGGSGDHSRAQVAFLTGARPKRTEGADIRAGVSIDQIAAREFGKQTQLASLELALESQDVQGACDHNYACAYTSTISWAGETMPLPMEANPRGAFERLFGTLDATDRKSRIDRIRRQRSILDSVSESMTRLQTGLGPADRTKLAEYLQAVRDIERRIQRAEEQSVELPDMKQPAGVPAGYDEYAAVMFDLIALAYQSDLTRVATIMMGRENSVRTYPEIGISEAHHPISHHQNRPEQLAKLAKINLFHMQLFANFVQKLHATADGDGTLLDHVILLYGAGLSDSNVHSHRSLPIAVVGGGSGQLKGGRHLKFGPVVARPDRVQPGDTPMANLHVTLLDKLGIPTEKFGDSSAGVNYLSML